MEFDRVWQLLVGFGAPLVGCWPAIDGSSAVLAGIVVVAAGCCSAAG